MKPRALHIRIELAPDEKKLLTQYFRDSGCGLREGLRRQAVNALFSANDWKREKESDLAKRNARRTSGEAQSGGR